MHENPLVSILCLSMNHAAFIERSFLSVVNQTYTNKEILYVDNNSSDNSYEIGEGILKNANSRYRSFKRQENYGISANINFLLNKANGKYITVLSADDFWDVTNLEKKIHFFEKNPDYGMLHSAGYIYRYANNELLIEKPLNTHSGWLHKEVLQRNFVNTVGVVIKKKVFDEVGYFDESSPIEDWDMWIRISGKYKILFYPEPLVYYGKREGENLSDNRIYMKKGHEYIFKKYAGEDGIEQAKHFYKMDDIYHSARSNPNIHHLWQLLKNFQFTFLHIKQIARCLAGISGLKKST